MSAHTPEPWTAGKSDLERGRVPIFAGKLGEIAAVTYTDGKGTQESDAARIVACVNGCAGLNPAAYRQVVVAAKEYILTKQTYRPAEQARMAMKKLLEALALAEAQQE